MNASPPAAKTWHRKELVSDIIYIDIKIRKQRLNESKRKVGKIIGLSSVCGLEVVVEQDLEHMVTMVALPVPCLLFKPSPARSA